MNLADYLEHILGILEGAGHPAIPLDSRMGVRRPNQASITPRCGRGFSSVHLARNTGFSERSSGLWNRASRTRLGSRKR